MMSRLAGLLVVLSVTVACDVKIGQDGVSVDVVHGTASDEWTRTYTLKPGGRVEVVTVSGTLFAEPSTGPDVEVVAVREARARTDEAAKELLGKAEFVEHVAPDRVSIESKLERVDGFGRQVTLEVTVKVPPGVNLSLKTRDGWVRMEGMQGAVTAESVNGRISGYNLSGTVTASTVNGPVRLSIAKVTGESRVTTVNGQVELGIPADSNASLEANVVNGIVDVDNGLKLTKSESTAQRVVGRLNDGGPTILAQTTNGRVRVQAGKLEPLQAVRRLGRRGAPPQP